MNKVKSESPTATVWRHAPSRYGGTELLLLLKIAGLKSAKDGCAHVRVHILAAMCGVETRRAQKILKKLKDDGMLRVKYRKGHSSIFDIKLDAIRELPLAVTPEASEEIENEQTAESAMPSSAEFIAHRLHMNFVGMKFEPAADWQTAWPVEIQKLLDAGNSVEVIRTVTRYALNVESYRAQIAKLGPSYVVQNFALFKEQAEAQGKVAA